MIRLRGHLHPVQLTIIVLLVSGISLIAASIAFVANDRTSTREAILRRLGILADVIGSNCTAAISFDNAGDATETLSALVAGDHLVAGQISTADGVLFARFTRDTLSPNSGGMPIPSDTHRFSGNHVHLWRRIVLESDTIGTGYLKADLGKLDARFWSFMRIASVVIGAALILALILTLHLQRVFSGPILRLANVARSVSTEQDYSLRAQGAGKDEVGFLVEQFNTMLARVQESNKALQGAYAGMEERVRERTRELEQEVAERRQTENELRQSEALLRLEQEDRLRLATAIEQSAEAVIITDASGLIQYVNPAFEVQFGMTRGTAIGRSALVLKSDLHEDPFYAHLWGTVSKGRNWTGRIQVKTPNGTVGHRNLSVSPIRDEHNQIINYVAASHDITGAVELEMQLRQAQKMEAIGSLAAGIAHEINTPIQFIGDNVRFMSDSLRTLIDLIGHSSELVRSCRDLPTCKEEALELQKKIDAADISFVGEEIPKAIMQTLDGVDRVATIVNAMLRFSHPGQNVKTPADINEALSNTLTITRSEWKQVANIVVDLGIGLPMVHCNINDINQVFLNLLVNASHAIADSDQVRKGGKGVITVRTRRDGDHLHVSIGDTGTGIPAEIRDRVFDPFFTTKSVGKGTGQGLAIAHAIVVDRHDGTLTYDSEIGRGTVFHVRLPFESTQDPEIGVSTQPMIRVRAASSA